MFTRILVPTDFSEPSDAALDYARALAARFGASLRLLHVVDPATTAVAFSNEVFVADTTGMYQASVREAEARFASRVRPSDRARYGMTTEIVTGQSAPTIVQYAEDLNMDLIVMGTHGRTGLAHLFMGSVAEHVVQRASCPVLTVRQPPAPKKAMASRSGQISRLDTAPGLG